MTIKIMQSFLFPNMVLKTIGYEFAHKPTSKWLLCLKRVLTHFYCSSYSIKQMYDIARNGMPNVPLFLRLTSSLMYTISGDVKLLNFVIHLKQSKAMFKRFQYIYPQSLEEPHSYQVNQHFWSSWDYGILYFYLLSTFFIIVSPVTNSTDYFGNCYNLLTTYYFKFFFQSKNIGNSAYNHRWYIASSSYKKSILIILIRAQKEADLNANSMQTISFEAFKILLYYRYWVRFIALLLYLELC
uniref:Odorant receptor n=1 Tax=Glossina morsitans morsitans TaxID=37546 RepID=A0A1B0GG22_GLOMM